MHRQVSQLAKQLGKAGVGDDGTDASTNAGSATAEKNEKGTSNRHNPSLTRQKRTAAGGGDTSK